MKISRALSRTPLAALLSGALVAASLSAIGLVGLTSSAAHADTAPADEGLPATVSADPLPTVQIDGVVWKQVIVGTTVYVGGEFTNARPAGAPAGTNLTPRSNFLAYDLTTGELITTIAPAFNAQVKDVAVSPDGTKLYVVGSFTSVDGQSRYRAAQFDITSGKPVLTNWKPTPNTTVNAVVPTNSTVFLGGSFSVINNTARRNLAAVSSAGAATLQPLNPTMVDGSVQDLVLSPDASQVVIGGNFKTVNGSSNPGYGLARIDVATSALLALPVNTQVRNAGTASAVLSLETDGTNFYGSGYDYGRTGNMEGSFSADWATGSLRWIEDCHGDTYSVFPTAAVVYQASHKHYCGNSGGFPQTTPWSHYNSTAVTNDVRGVNTKDIHGYADHPGQPRPEMLDWYPDWTVGTYTGQGQATWTVTGNADYVLYGGEFPRVGNVPQQGLVRFARSELAPNKVGPQLSGGNFALTTRSVAAGSVRLSWPGNPDPDNATTTYKLYRNSTAEAPIYSTTVTKHFWELPINQFVDTGLAPGSSQRYRVTASDPMGNTAMSEWVTVTVADADALSTYGNSVLASMPDHYWRLGEGSGTTSTTLGGATSNLTRSSGATWTSSGAITGDTNGASNFSGTSTGLASTRDQVSAPRTFSIEAWFKTNTLRGGKIVGFGSVATGSSTIYDRHVYMTNAGKLIFGVSSGGAATLTTAKSYNDNVWHHVVASLSPSGMALYVDGARIGRRTDVTPTQTYTGYWRVGGDALGSWPSAPTSGYFAGSIDEVAIYPTALTTAEVQRHYTDSGRSVTTPTAPADAYGKAVYQDDPDLYWRFAETSGSAVADSSVGGGIGATLSGSYLRNQTGPLAGAPSGSAAVKFGGTQGSSGASSVTFTSPQVYTLEAWFSTTSTAGGKVIGFGNAATGNSTSYDRHVYLTNDGRVVYGIYNGTQQVITTAGSYNDGTWHHVVATQGRGGMKLYLDGVLQGTNPTSQAEATTGYWRIGGDVTWGSTSNYLNGSIAEVAVYPTVLDDLTVANHYGLGTTGQIPNQLPTAAFTSTAAKLAVAFDGTASSDPDGSVISYAWDFGDGTTGTGASPSHTYAAAGSYPVTLTVTDDRSGTASVTHPVSVVANQAPVAAFNLAATGLTVAFDGSESSDADGNVSSYAWDFGDGQNGAGATTSHTYAADGTYTVTLQVTDNDGAQSSVSHDVTVAAPADPTVARDGFERAITGGWGSAEMGGAWTSVGSASRFSVAAGQGLHTLPAGATDESRLNSTSARDVDVTASVGIDKIPTSGYVYAILGARQTGTADGYVARVRFNPDGTVGAHLLSGSTAVVGANAVSGLSVAAGERVLVRFQTQGAAPTTLRVKVWKAGTAEPSAWTYTRTDATATNQGPGAIILKSYAPSTGNNPIVVSWDDLAVVNLP